MSKWNRPMTRYVAPPRPTPPPPTEGGKAWAINEARRRNAADDQHWRARRNADRTGWEVVLVTPFRTAPISRGEPIR